SEEHTSELQSLTNLVCRLLLEKKSKPRGAHFQRLQMQPFEDAESDQTDEDQIDRDDEIEEPRHDEDQDARDQGHDGRNVRGGDDHCSVSGILGNRVGAWNLAEAVPD